MEKSNKVVPDLSQEVFDKFPVWCWTDDREAYQPVINTSPLPDDLGELFIKARFTACSGDHFNGYIIVHSSPYAIGLFSGGREYIFNLNAPDFAIASLDALKKTCGLYKLILFPIQYETDHGFSKGDLMTGVFMIEGVR